MSQGSKVNLNLLSWTITPYEVDDEGKIGGSSSDVYRGTWLEQTVAIKVVAETTPRNLFIREVGIWKTLQHPNVLELYGASSASGDPPWFFVSPYLKNGTLVEFLRRVDGGTTGGLSDSRNSMGAGWKGWDLLKFMHEVAEGMAYLHSNGVLHGDLKASNVLVDNGLCCVISDFGQSEMKSEACRISGMPLPYGTLRWQAPELMMGLSQLTTEMDVYAFAMCCIEILSMGRMPWPFMDDYAVRNLVLVKDSRPDIPSTHFSTSALQDLIGTCWQREPSLRPNFSTIVQELKQMRKSSELPEVVSLKFPEWRDNESFEFRVSRPSPDMHPVPLLPGTPPRDLTLGPLQGSPSASFRTARDMSASPPMPSLPFREAPMNVHMPEPMAYISSAPSSHASSTAESTTPSFQSEDESIRNMMEYDGYDSPPVAEARDERRYRLLLTHEFHPSLTLPLWTPSQVYLGAVGYLQKPEGAFVTLFNCVNPEKSPDEHPVGMSSVHGYGEVTVQIHRPDQRSAAQKDAFPSTSSRRYSHPLRAGHKTAFLHTETTVYTYVENLDAPRKWFKANVDEILATYGTQHRIQKEDLFLVIGTLTTPDYALFVSHGHPDGQAYFDVLPPGNGQPWGVIKTDNEVPSELGGPSYHEDLPFVSTSKISRNGSRDATVLIARLRFKPDVLEPTSM
ncbi:kinase-like protein [Guyanagaster necrorhizus]|uniref:Kinase-like protein n=1 Tax=Guyanagaster necrorhizus TaxID=856835 RepID=A0A9P7VN71_9AGAR|nr:kinase-like protein [Guyanagaster necrorhizus MCA 3950]KAG7443814.1 kinase-like protein [Guyanagaster necrorhizus MCA 3950]